MEYDIGLRLRELREKKKLTQEQVGARIGVTGSNVSGYELNTISPPADMLRKLALLYGVTADYLLGIDDRNIIVIDLKKPIQVKALMESIAILQNAFEQS